MTYALEQEFKRESGEKRIARLSQAEAAGSYPEVASLTRLIEDDTRLVVVDGNTVAAIHGGGKIDRRQLVTHSVQMWCSKIKALALREIGFGREEIYEWSYDYDRKFLGVMAGVLKLDGIRRNGIAASAVLRAAVGTDPHRAAVGGEPADGRGPGAARTGA
jgi:hypothetical protein